VIRLCVGIETLEDIIADLEQALSKAAGATQRAAE
jgi:cystathionine beta-lyase/cystathionine gamma-synthase